MNSCCRQHPEDGAGNSPSFFQVFVGRVGRRQKAHTTLAAMEATSAGRDSHWHSHCHPRSSLSRHRDLGRQQPRFTRREQGPNCPRLASQVRAVSLGHVETLQEKISCSDCCSSKNILKGTTHAWCLARTDAVTAAPAWDQMSPLPCSPGHLAAAYLVPGVHSSKRKRTEQVRRNPGRDLRFPARGGHQGLGAPGL